MKAEKTYSVPTLLSIAALVQIVWGATPSASTIVIKQIPVELYIALRFIIAGAIFFGYGYATNRISKISLKTFAKVSMLGFIGYGIGSLGFLYALKLGGVVNFALVASVGPLITSIASILLLSERPTRTFMIALPICIIGLLTLVAGKHQISSNEIAIGSALLAILGCTCEAIIFVYSKRLKEQTGVVQYLAIAQLILGIAMLGLATALGQTQKISALTLEGWVAIVYVSIVACCLCYGLLYWLLQKIDGHKLALFDGLHALSAASFGVLLLNEQFSPLMIIGGVLLITALILGNWPHSAAKEDAIPEVL